MANAAFTGINKLQFRMANFDDASIGGSSIGGFSIGGSSIGGSSVSGSPFDDSDRLGGLGKLFLA